ncbi:hypothetical protein DUI87_14581 [Hirundo rustica rustica]|uniref:Uncharacterized protein n=1 Tax=Hirundo rustica rustica TaxID=333673 RepID=A0A3M0K558_HIRRU|nr:hypothetical protein DUI87_14581 [Hirundo rustica rustica]
MELEHELINGGGSRGGNRATTNLHNLGWNRGCSHKTGEPVTDEQGPAEPRKTRHKRTKSAGPYPLERCRIPSPSLCQLEELGLWAGSALRPLLKERGSKERHWFDACQARSYGEESLSESGSNDPNKLENYRGPGQFLKLFLQDTDQSVSHGEDSKAQECCQKKNGISICTIWVSPLNPELMVEAEEADADLPCTSPAPAAPMLQVATVESRALAPHNPCCPPSPLPSQQEDLGQWAGAAARALLEELWGEEGSCCEELRSGPSPECAEHTDLSRSAEEESTSGSLQSEPWPEDTEPSRMTREESSLVSLPRKAWTADQDLSCSTGVKSASGSLPHESWAESSDSEACIAPEDGLDQLGAALICPPHVNPLLPYMGTGTVRSQKKEAYPKGSVVMPII